MQSILEFGLFMFVLLSPVIILWLIDGITDIIAYKIINKKDNFKG